MSRTLVSVNGDKVVELRKSGSCSTKELAEKCSLSVATVKRAENSQRVTDATLLQLANGLSVAPHVISREEFEWDVFISHASEDKLEFVEELAQSLVRNGLKVWYDANVLQVGDDLEERIKNGISETEFGVIILSSYYVTTHPCHYPHLSGDRVLSGWTR